jgi:hypothetical protein
MSKVAFMADDRSGDPLAIAADETLVSCCAPVSCGFGSIEVSRDNVIAVPDQSHQR